MARLAINWRSHLRALPIPIIQTHLGREETSNGHAGGQADCHRHAGDAQRYMVGGAEVERHKGQPNHTGGVHGEACKEVKGKIREFLHIFIGDLTLNISHDFT